MFSSPRELETNYVNHINLDEISLLEYDVTIHNFKPFLSAKMVLLHSSRQASFLGAGYVAFYKKPV